MALRTLGERLESLQASIERSELALENSVGSENNIKRESLNTLYAQERKLELLIEQKGADYVASNTSRKAPRRANVRFS